MDDKCVKPVHPPMVCFVPCTTWLVTGATAHMSHGQVGHRGLQRAVNDETLGLSFKTKGTETLCLILVSLRF